MGIVKLYECFPLINTAIKGNIKKCTSYSAAISRISFSVKATSTNRLKGINFKL